MFHLLTLTRTVSFGDGGFLLFGLEVVLRLQLLGVVFQSLFSDDSSSRSGIHESLTSRDHQVHGGPWNFHRARLAVGLLLWGAFLARFSGHVSNN